MEESTQLNLSYLDEMSGGDSEFICEILDTFLESSFDLVNSIEAAAKSRNAEAAHQVTHTLKGSSRSIGAEGVAKICEDMERFARSGDMDGYAALAPKLSHAFQSLSKEIQALSHGRAA